MDKTEANKRLAAIESEAEKLRALINAPEQPLPQKGEVWRDESYTYIVGAFYGKLIATCTDGLNWDDPAEPEDLFAGFDDFKRLGTFDEVYVERSKIEEEYVTREELQDFLRGDCSEAASSVRMKLSDRFEIDY